MSSPQDDYKQHVDQLKQRISCHDVADKLDFKRTGAISGGKATYHTPWGSKNNTTLSVFDDGHAWKDFSENIGGSVIDLVMRGLNLDFKPAVQWLCDEYNMPLPRTAADPNAPRREVPLHEMIADQCLKTTEPAVDYLASRGITEAIARRAIKARTLGYNDYRNPKYAEGEPNHGGPAVGFIVVTPNPGHVVAVEMRYLDPAINGKIKNKCLGDKAGHAWCSNWKWLLDPKCHTVYVCEGPINALSIESAELPGTAALATMGTENVDKIDWRILRGKRVLICLDHNDRVQDNEKSKLFGYRAGLYFAWRLHEALTACDVSAQLVDQDGWPEGKDVNDILQKDGAGVLAEKLINVEEWLIAGLNPKPKLHSRARAYLASHHWAKYSRFRVTSDSTRWIKAWKKQANDEGEDVVDVPEFEDVASFRVAGMSRVSIQSPQATMTGAYDTSPRHLFSVSVQVPRHKNRLIRAVFEDAHLHKMDRWERFGSVFSQQGFRRMVSVLETTTDIGARDAMNLVGLGWRAGRLQVNEGHECYFSDPDTQCPYHALAFPRGTEADARTVLRAYQATMKNNAALMVLVWALGAHLKAFLGFWPHLTLSGNKGSGKSTLTKALERSIGMTMLSRQSLQTEYRMVRSLSYTTHPVGWEEISAGSEQRINDAVKNLQEAYNYAPTTRGYANTEFLICAPALLAGEDVPVRSLIGKLVAVKLTGKKGVEMDMELPAFPVFGWLKHLATLDKREVREAYQRLVTHCQRSSRAAGTDDGASRMAGNYAAVLTAWTLLADWLSVDPRANDLGSDVMAAMNLHIKETSGDREPWVWIVETILSEMAMREFRFPAKWETIETESGDRECLLIRLSHMVDHLSRTTALRSKWEGLPIKSSSALKDQLIHARAVLLQGDGQLREFERTIGAEGLGGSPGRRVSHLVALDLTRLSEFGVHAVTPGDGQEMPQ